MTISARMLPVALIVGIATAASAAPAPLAKPRRTSSPTIGTVVAELVSRDFAVGELKQVAAGEWEMPQEVLLELSFAQEPARVTFVYRVRAADQNAALRAFWEGKGRNVRGEK